MTGSDSSVALQKRAGNFEQALAHGHELLGRRPAAALEQAHMLLTRAGPDPRAFRLAAAACRALGKAGDAEDAELAAIQAGTQGPEIRRALLAEKEGRRADVKSILEGFLQEQPDDLLVLTMLAEAALSELDLERAETMLRTVLGRASTFLRASALLAKSLSLQARPRDAIAVVEEVLTRKPRNLTALRQLAPLFTEVGSHDRAAAIYERILAEDEPRRDVWNYYAQTLRFLGRKADSQAAYRRALSIDRGSGTAWWGLANYYPSTLGPDDELTMRKALAERSDNLAEASSLHIALSVLADRKGDHSTAFEHVAAGKQRRLEMHPYDPEWTTVAVDQSMAAFKPKSFTGPQPSDMSESSPIFMVGMPRSGTTMVERILAQHSAIEGAGELPLIQRLVNRLRVRAGSADYRPLVASMSADELEGHGRWYLERSRDFRHSDKRLFVDKWNSNWLHLGLIRLILPNARIVDIRRSPLDCCWSNFKMLFAEGHPAANDLSHIGRFYRDYVRMIGGVQAFVPGSVLTVHYEALVGDIETETRRILDFVGLDYEPACVHFHLSTDPVATPSSEQVRRKINREGIGSAAPYEQWLGPLREALGDLADG